MRFDLSKSFNKFIEIVRKSVIDGIKRGSQFGRSFQSNAKSTINKKGHNQPLQGKSRNGKWLKAKEYKIEKATPSKQEASVEVPQPDIAMYNQTGTKRGIPARPFWGVSEQATKSMNKSVNYDINKYVDKSIISMGFKKV